MRAHAHFRRIGRLQAATLRRACPRTNVGLRVRFRARVNVTEPAQNTLHMRINIER
jgi:hypothetical protein